MDLVDGKELLQELPQLLSVQEPVVVRVELSEVLLYLLVQMVFHVSEVNQSLQNVF